MSEEVHPNSLIRKPWHFWNEYFDANILDPDGFRGALASEDDLYTASMFLQRWLLCTINRPSEKFQNAMQLFKFQPEAFYESLHDVEQTESLSEEIVEEPDRWFVAADFAFWNDCQLIVLEKRTRIIVEARNVSFVDEYRVQEVK